ncbi:MAG: hypothetical protein KBS69_06765 [Bacteroidales bacterium]|nr:hypothetical protein [Candidatus Colicola caccequi]
MTHDKMIAVITAHKEGKLIEFKRIDGGYPHHWTRCDDPVWNFGVCEYRVRPEEPKPTYRPYKDAEECFKDALKHGGWINIRGQMGMITLIKSYGIELGEASASYSTLLDFTWADDGSPCGVKED